MYTFVVRYKYYVVHKEHQVKQCSSLLAKFVFIIFLQYRLHENLGVKLVRLDVN